MRATEPQRAGGGLRQPQLRAYHDRADRYHFALAHDAEDAIGYWKVSARWLLHGDLPPSSPTFLLGSLLLFDGLITQADLPKAWAALAEAYVDHDGYVCIEWRSDGDPLQRRRLSSVTVLSLSKQTGAVSFSSARDELLRVWPDTPTELCQVLERLSASMVLMLSGDLAAHVVGQQRLTAVNRSCLVRKATRAALSHLHYHQTLELAPDPVSLALLDALHSQSGRQGGHEPLVQHMVQAVRPDTEALPGAAQQRASSVAHLRALAPAAEADGPWSVFLLMFVLQLVRVGTRYKSPLATRTVEEYVALALPPLAKRLVRLQIEEAAQIDWRDEVYDPILCDPTIPESQLGKLAAALSAAHDLAVSVIGAAPLTSRLSQELPEVRVAANVVWPHEVDTILQWFGTMPAEDRLAAQARAKLAILASAACRYQDMLHIHMFGVRRDGAVLRISIDPLPSAGSGKTDAARRTIDIVDSRFIEIVDAWLERRRTEGAMPRDLFFGDPEDGRRAFRQGASLGLLNAALKAVTGDAHIGTHDLRHSFLSRARASASVLDQQLLDHMSAAAGHEWTSTTLKVYCNLYEKPLRAQLDSQMHKLSLTEKAASRLAGIQPGRLRKRKQRNGGELDSVCWAAVEDTARSMSFASVSDGFEVDIPLNPFAPTPRPLTFATYFAVLTDLAAERKPDTIVLRHGVQRSLVDGVARAVDEWSTRRGIASSSPGAGIPWKGSWSRARRPKWFAVRRALETATAEQLLPVAESWAKVSTPLHFNLQDPHAAEPLLYWLSKTGLHGGQFVLHHEETANPKAALDLLEAVFGQLAPSHQVQPRRGRCKVYLSVQSTVRDNTSAPNSNAAASLTGLQVLLFSAWVWSRVEGRRYG